MTLKLPATTLTHPITVTVTGAAGQIGYALLFRIASGQMFGEHVPVRLNLLEIPQAMRSLEGTAMELEDCAFPLLSNISLSDDASRAFEGTNVAILVGSRPRTAGMERADLLEANSGIFGPQGAAINAGAAENVRIVVVGNPANTNALIASANAPDVPPERFSALTRLDHNRAVSQVARKAQVNPSLVKRLTIWGNHSASLYPDIAHTVVGDQPIGGFAHDESWLESDFVPTVARRGAAIIDVRGASSAASAANAIVDHVGDLARGTADGDWTSAAVWTRGEYGISEGLYCSLPVTCRAGGDWEVVEGLPVGAYAQAKIDASVAELVAERDAVRSLGLL